MLEGKSWLKVSNEKTNPTRMDNSCLILFIFNFSASSVKMVNQLLAGVHIASSAEAMAFGARLGLSTRKLFDAITNSGGTSWYMPCLLEPVATHSPLTCCFVDGFYFNAMFKYPGRIS